MKKEKNQLVPVLLGRTANGSAFVCKAGEKSILHGQKAVTGKIKSVIRLRLLRSQGESGTFVLQLHPEEFGDAKKIEVAIKELNGEIKSNGLFAKKIDGVWTLSNKAEDISTEARWVPAFSSRPQNPHIGPVKAPAPKPRVSAIEKSTPMWTPAPKPRKPDNDYRAYARNALKKLGLSVLPDPNPKAVAATLQSPTAG